MVEEILVRVVEGLIKGIVAGSLELSESSGKTSHTVSYCFWMSTMRFSFWSAWKEKGGKDCSGAC